MRYWRESRFRSDAEENEGWSKGWVCQGGWNGGNSRKDLIAKRDVGYDGGSGCAGWEGGLEYLDDGVCGRNLEMESDDGDGEWNAGRTECEGGL